MKNKYLIIPVVAMSLCSMLYGVDKIVVSDPTNPTVRKISPIVIVSGQVTNSNSIVADAVVGVTTSSGAGDSGKIAKLNASGQFASGFISAPGFSNATNFTANGSFTVPSGVTKIKVEAWGLGGTGGAGGGGGANPSLGGGAGGGGGSATYTLGLHAASAGQIITNIIGTSSLVSNLTSGVFILSPGGSTGSSGVAAGGTGAGGAGGAGGATGTGSFIYSIAGVSGSTGATGVPSGSSSTSPGGNGGSVATSSGGNGGAGSNGVGGSGGVGSSGSPATVVIWY